MTESEYLFLLDDRIQKIRQMDAEHDLRGLSYVSFSGGKDSSVLSSLIDKALPGNKIPRVYINTGIEYRLVSDFVKEVQRTDGRVCIVAPKRNIRQTLDEYGYPFKSKDHAEKVDAYQKAGKLLPYLRKYLGEGKKSTFNCPKKLRYQFTPEFKLRVSKKCCEKLKKEPANEWADANGKTITVTGMRKGEGGSRMTIGCTVFDGDKLKKFHPLFPMTDEWMDEYIRREGVPLPEIYRPPYNFERTGCKGCPFNIHIQKDLDIMEKYFPSEKRQCEIIWKPVYDEYRRIGYRLKRREPEPLKELWEV